MSEQSPAPDVRKLNFGQPLYSSAEILSAKHFNKLTPKKQRPVKLSSAGLSSDIFAFNQTTPGAPRRQRALPDKTKKTDNFSHIIKGLS
jgi:hypothetical protein